MFDLHLLISNFCMSFHHYLTYCIQINWITVSISGSLFYLFDIKYLQINSVQILPSPPQKKCNFYILGIINKRSFIIKFVSQIHVFYCNSYLKGYFNDISKVWNSYIIHQFKKYIYKKSMPSQNNFFRHSYFFIGKYVFVAKTKNVF